MTPIEAIIEDIYAEFPCCKVNFEKENDNEYNFIIKLYIAGEKCKIKSTFDYYTFNNYSDEDIVKRVLNDMEYGVKELLNKRINN